VWYFRSAFYRKSREYTPGATRECLDGAVMSYDGVDFLMLGPYLDRRAALVIAHPGHELRVYHWLNLARPLVFVLTDGSGYGGASRLPKTTSILKSLGSPVGSIYGPLTDLDIYSAILEGDINIFIEIAAELSKAFVDNEIEYVVGDAMEGYNPTHDICRLLINAAVKRNRQMGRWIDNFDVLLAYRFADDDAPAMTNVIAITGDDEMHARKLGAARAYSELAADVDRIVEEEGTDALRTEYLRPVREDTDKVMLQEPPYYEVHGENQVAAGRYQQVIRYRDHVRPIAESLRRFAESKGPAVGANSDYK
jgi:hypothetical protein